MVAHCQPHGISKEKQIDLQLAMKAQSRAITRSQKPLHARIKHNWTFSKNTLSDRLERNALKV